MLDQFLRATNAYQAWLDCGKDYASFEHLYHEWDKECVEMMRLSGMNRMMVINQIRKALGIVTS
ncbi:MAG: hypothetical protein EBT26_11590 [Microbacteriaceae bacterium]|nr:hypothetical protein [Microbacteriaceae bacterium]